MATTQKRFKMIKKHLTTSFFLSSLLLASACSKDDGGKEYCWECNISTKTTVPSYPELNDVTTTSIEQCGMTEDQIKAFEKSGTTTVTSTSGGVSATVSSTTRCNKK